MRKAKTLAALMLSATLVVSALSPASAGAMEMATVSDALAADYKEWKIANANEKDDAAADAKVSRFYYQVYNTAEREDGKTGAVTLDKLKATGHTLGDIYGVRFLTNVDPEVENYAGFNGVIQFAHSTRAVPDKNGKEQYTESDGKYTRVEYKNTYYNFATGDIIYQEKIGGRGITDDGRKPQASEITNLVKTGGYETTSSYWITPSFSVPKYPTWTAGKESGKYHTLLNMKDGSIEYSFKVPIGNDLDRNFMVALVVYQTANQRTGIGVTGVQLLGKDGEVLLTDTSMGDVNNITSVSYKQSSATLGVGEAEYVPAAFAAKTVTVSGDPYKYTNGAGISYTSENEKVAKIVTGQENIKELDGKNYKTTRVNYVPAIKGVAEGTTRIKATPFTRGADGKIQYATKSAYLTVNVKPAPASVQITSKKSSLYPGQSFTIGKKVLPANAVSSNFFYTSSKAKVAMVSPDGKVTALKKGTTTITVKTYNGKTASFKLKVKDLKKVKVKKATVASNAKKVKVTWKKSSISSVKGYQVSVSSTKKFKKATTKNMTVKGKKKTKATVKVKASLAKKIVKAKTCYVCVKSYTTVDGKKIYSPKGNVKKIKVK